MWRRCKSGFQLSLKSDENDTVGLWSLAYWRIIIYIGWLDSDTVVNVQNIYIYDFKTKIIVVSNDWFVFVTVYAIPIEVF